MNRKKVMLLSTHDSHLGGHAWSEMQQYDKKKYDVNLVSLYSLYNDNTYSIIRSLKVYNILNKIWKAINHLYYFKRRHNIYNDKYCFFNINSFPVSAEMILKKFNKGNPDVIVLHWYDGFITPTIISELYKLTSAQFVFVFTDEYPLGGGCHYPCECEGYKYDCKNCPALLLNKRIAEKKLKEKIKLLQGIPKIIISPSAGLNKAKQAAVFRKNTDYIRYLPQVILNVKPLSLDESRAYFDITSDSFVVMYGAMHIDEKRKGFDLFKEALKIVSKEIDEKIVVVVAGTGESLNKLSDIENVFIKHVGCLQFNDLCKLYTASNVYVSSSIADSGPMMVAYSIACGTPVVAFPIGYAVDCVIHKETGYLAEFESIQDLANGILFFYKNRNRQLYFSDNCLRLNEKFSKHPFYGNLL